MPSKDAAATAASGSGSRRRPGTRKTGAAAPARRPAGLEVKLGHVAENGIAAGMYALIERGVAKRPKIAKGLRGSVEIRFKEAFAPMRVEFGASEVVVGDLEPAGENGDRAPRADLIITGSLPQVVQLASAPLFGGLPKPTDARGRAGLRAVAGRRVKIEGSPLLARRVLKLLEI
jgi:hypothetical protein